MPSREEISKALSLMSTVNKSAAIDAVIALFGDYSKVSRLTIIDHRTGGQGVVVERYGIAVDVMPLQDDGRTLKIRMIDHE